MTELIGLLIGYVIVSEREWLMNTFLPRSEPRAHIDHDPDWIHSVTNRYADPIDDLRAGYIDKYVYAERMSRLKRFVTSMDFA